MSNRGDERSENGCAHRDGVAARDRLVQLCILQICDLDDELAHRVAALGKVEEEVAGADIPMNVAGAAKIIEN